MKLSASLIELVKKVLPASIRPPKELHLMHYIQMVESSSIKEIVFDTLSIAGSVKEARDAIALVAQYPDLYPAPSQRFVTGILVGLAVCFT